MTNNESLEWETFIYTALISPDLLTQAAGMHKSVCVCQVSEEKWKFTGLFPHNCKDNKGVHTDRDMTGILHTVKYTGPSGKSRICNPWRKYCKNIMVFHLKGRRSVDNNNVTYIPLTITSCPDHTSGKDTEQTCPTGHFYWKVPSCMVEFTATWEF